MSATNGTKTFLWLVTHEHKHGVDTNLLRSDHDPSVEEVVEALQLDYTPEDDIFEAIEVERIDPDSIITLKPKPH